MELADLIAQFRIDTDDLQEPYLSSDAMVTSWLDEAEQEAAIRARLIHETSDVSVCTIAVTAGVSTYTLHASVIDVTRAAFTPTGSTEEQVLYLTDHVELDRIYPLWRTQTDVPRYAMQTDTTLRLAAKPSTNGTLALECYRLPLSSMADTDAPEIGAIHHRHLVQWALHRCYSRPDAEVNDPGRAALAEREFTRVFGLRPDADYRRASQENRPHANVAVW